jgi:predicted lipoprotein with Yx(FWY)xxD motif
MQRGRHIHIAALAGVLALAAGTMQPAHGAAVAVNTAAAPILTPGDGAVLVTFGSVFDAVGYNIYSHAAGAAPALVNAKPDAYTWFNDDGGGKGLKNGTPLFYSVKAVLMDSTGKMTEGPASAENVVVPNPPIFGLVAYNFTTPGTDVNPGTVSYDKAKDLITVHTSGDDIWDAHDGQTFAGTKVSGDFTITAKIPAPPTGGDPVYGKIGLEMRTSLESDAPYAYVFASVMRDPEVMFEGHFGPEGANAASNTVFSAGTTNFADLKFPVWVRLSRSGTVMAAQQSEDGTKWTDVTAAQDFGRLAPDLYVGIGATAHNDDPTMYLDGQIVASSLTITTP